MLGLALALTFAVADWADTSIGRPSLLALGALLGAALLGYRFVLSKRPGGWTPRLEDAHSGPPASLAERAAHTTAGGRSSG